MSRLERRIRGNPTPLAPGDGWSGVRVSVKRLEGYPGRRVEQARDVVEAFRRIIPSDDEREHFAAIYLDGKHAVKGWTILTIGTLGSSMVHPRETFRPAILLGAAALVCAHNHPSGDPQPSREDLQITERLRDAGQLIGITLLDHVVLGHGDRFVSFREKGYVL